MRDARVRLCLHPGAMGFVAPPSCPCQPAHPVLRCRVTSCMLAPPRDEYPCPGHGRKPHPPILAIGKWKMTSGRVPSLYWLAITGAGAYLDGKRGKESNTVGRLSRAMPSDQSGWEGWDGARKILPYIWPFPGSSQYLGRKQTKLAMHPSPA